MKTNVYIILYKNKLVPVPSSLIRSNMLHIKTNISSQHIDTILKLINIIEKSNVNLSKFINPIKNISISIELIKNKNVLIMYNTPDSLSTVCTLEINVNNTKESISKVKYMYNKLFE